MNKGKDQMRKDTTKERQEAGGEGADGKGAKHVEPGRKQRGKQRTRTGTSGGEVALDGSVRGSRRKMKRPRQETARRASTRTGEGGERGQEEQDAGSERRRRRMRGGWAHGTRTRVARATRRPQGTRTVWEAAQERGAGAGGERPMLGAQNGPRMDEDPVGPRHRVAGGPVGYKHGMRDGMGPHNSPGDYAGAAAQRKRAGRERPVLGARNGPRMDEDPVGPRHRVAGGLVGYKHGMRDGMGPHNSPGD